MCSDIIGYGNAHVHVLGYYWICAIAFYGLLVQQSFLLLSSCKLCEIAAMPSDLAMLSSPDFHYEYEAHVQYWLVGANTWVDLHVQRFNTFAEASSYIEQVMDEINNDDKWKELDWCQFIKKTFIHDF